MYEMLIELEKKLLMWVCIVDDGGNVLVDLEDKILKEKLELLDCERFFVEVKMCVVKEIGWMDCLIVYVWLLGFEMYKIGWYLVIIEWMK